MPSSYVKFQNCGNVKMPNIPPMSKVDPKYQNFMGLAYVPFAEPEESRSQFPLCFDFTSIFSEAFSFVQSKVVRLYDFFFFSSFALFESIC